MVIPWRASRCDTLCLLQCHTVDGVEFEPNKAQPDKIITLGGASVVVKTYGNLVTSIINPSLRQVSRCLISKVVDRNLAFQGIRAANVP